MIPRAHQLPGDIITSDDRAIRGIGPHTIDHDGATYTIYPALSCDIANFHIGEHHSVIGVTLTRPVHTRPGGAGLSYAFSAETARNFAAQLLEAAGRLEAAAAAEATAALAKAAGK